eukprot:scaffold2782_cov182-Amphora_coffeaeformis.AAC.1
MMRGVIHDQDQLSPGALPDVILVALIWPSTADDADHCSAVVQYRVSSSRTSLHLIGPPQWFMESLA